MWPLDSVHTTIKVGFKPIPISTLRKNKQQVRDASSLCNSMEQTTISESTKGVER